MTMQNVTNFKTSSEIKMQIELDAWRNGEKQWMVHNQFDESVLESALENMDKMSDEKWAWWANAEASLMSLANALSEFEVEELHSGWVN